ncbi:MAG: formate C-acetyltransferase/glycerol dehydratase family glycyl radical enzyme [Actinomycetota bacterium]|nr:formate C-acetyltransferase/glycerol dehydratase family glycyl radical enzyme [Actinomycetota bacterium]
MNKLSYKNRIRAVREELVNVTPSICPERALLLTDSYKETEMLPIMLRRAKALDKILTGMSIFIEKGQMIAGNQASKIRAAPIFPEYSIKWVIDELDEFDKRPGDKFLIDEPTKKQLKSIYSYWKGKTHQDQVNKTMGKENILAQRQNVLHYGRISMSGDGHIIPDHEKLLSIGCDSVIKEAKERLRENNIKKDQGDFYKASIIALESAIKFASRYASLAAGLADTENDPDRKHELMEISEVCSKVLRGRTQSYHEALQLVYFLHLVMIIESNGHSFSFGRFDQYMYPFYKADIESGRLTPEKAVELTALFFIKLNLINKVRLWGHTQFGVGYPLYSNLMVGGMKSDHTDGTNDLSYTCLKAIDLSRLPEPNFSVRYWSGSPKRLLVEASRIIKKGFGMPSMFCDETAIKALLSIGIPETVARDYASMGCVEIAIPGRWGHRATGMTYINLGKILELLLHNGYDKETGIQLISINGTDSSIYSLGTYGELWQGWCKFLKFYTDLAVSSDRVCDISLEYHDSDSFASSLVQKCIDRGKTLKAGGAEYDFVSHSVIGPTIAGNSLAVIKKLVFYEQKVSYIELINALDANWQGKRESLIRKMVEDIPKFGNDNDYFDNIVKDIYWSYINLLPDYKNERYGKGPFGCGYTMSTSNISSYVPYGMEVKATPDGRFSGDPLNEGASPTIGTDYTGPTAVINSISKLPNEYMAGGQLLNMKISPNLLKGEDNLNRFVSFLEAARRMKIFHLQFNIINTETLIAAKENPQKYRDLMVRVAGYCALFVSLVPEVQDAIIKRTEYSSKT